MSRLADMQARFQQRQMQEKEEKLLKLYESQQQRAFERVSRGSASNNINGGTSPVGQGKVRQMFDERRQKAGIDRSYPLEPIKQSSNGHTNGYRVPNADRSNLSLSRNNVKSTSTFKSTVQRSISQSKNGKPPVTHSIKQTANGHFVNGQLESGNVDYEIRSNQIDALSALKSQEKELEIMIKNYRIDDDDFVDAIDYVDNKLSENNIPAIDTGKIQKDKTITNTNNRKMVESPPVGTQIKKTNLKSSNTITKERMPTKKPVAKTQSSPKASPTQSPAHSSRPSSAIDHHSPSPLSTPEKKSQMKSAAPSPTQRRTNASPQTKSSTTGRSVLSARSTPGTVVNRDDLKPCRHCNRRFAMDRIHLHEEICARTLKKKRKVYDPIKHRVQGTDAENYVKKMQKSGKVVKDRPVVKSDWRRQHEEFISTIRAAKQAQAHVAAGGKLSDLPPPPPSYNPDYIQCPHCGRRFNETAAARHIPKCATMLHNKPNRPGLSPKKRF